LGCAVYAAHAQEERTLVWAEEFDTPTLLSDVWNIESGDGCPTLCGWGNNERQIYTATNHRIENGTLIIQAQKKDEQYTATRINTKGMRAFQYGRIETRIKLPQGKGLWPAFWLLGENIDTVGWPQCGEIDVMEYVGKKPGEIFTSLHTQSSFGNTINTKTITCPDIEDGFHTFAVDWSEEKIAFYVDHTLEYTYQPPYHTKENWPFDQPFYLLINLAIGGNFGGPEVDDTIFPQEYIIDYIRVYQ